MFCERKAFYEEITLVETETEMFVSCRIFLLQNLEYMSFNCTCND